MIASSGRHAQGGTNGSAGESRRAFWPVRPDWLAQHHEAALEPGLPIVDPHHHLWDRARQQLPAARPDRRHRQRPQHRGHGVRRMPGDVSRRRRRDAALAGRDRVRERHRRHECERRLRRDAGLPRHRRQRRPALRRSRQGGARGARRRRGRPLQGHPQRGALASRADCAPVRPRRRKACCATPSSAAASRRWAQLGPAASTPGCCTRSSTI